MQERLRIGMIVASSNTWAEPVTYRLLEEAPDVTVHFARVDIAAPSFTTAFGGEGMAQAARQLADAEVEVIMWNGSSGSWLGIQRDQELSAELARICGVPASTSTLALLESCRMHGVKRLGLVTPYSAEVNADIAREYASVGIEVVAESHLGIQDNMGFSCVPEADLAQEVRAIAPGADAAMILCTNLNGAFVAPLLEAELGIPVFDSITITLSHALQLGSRDE